LGPTRESKRITNQMAKKIAIDGIDAVIDWAEALPDDPQRGWAKKIAFRAGMSVVARMDLSRAIAWYEAHREFDYAGPSFRSLAFVWMHNDDPVSLFEWLQQQPDGKLRLETIRRSYRQWLERDEEEATAWMRGVTLTPALDPAVAVFVRLESRDSPWSAVEWANRIEDQALRRMTIVPILRRLAQEDSAAVLAWMVEHDYPVSVRNDILGNLSRAADKLRQEREAETEATATATAP